MSELTTWLGELKLSGYSVKVWKKDSILVRKRRTSLNLWLSDCGRRGWLVMWVEGYPPERARRFQDFDEMADFVEQKLRTWPDPHSMEPSPVEMPHG